MGPARDETGRETGESSAAPEGAGAAIDPRHLRGALEFAARVAVEGRKQHPPLPVPAGLKRFVGGRRIPTGGLAAVRRAVEGDPEFRERVARAATPELVDPIGLVWLTRPDGWRERLAELVAEAERAEQDRSLAEELTRERRRREAAEAVAARARAELLGLKERLAQVSGEADELRAAAARSADGEQEARAELVEARNELRHANDRLTAAIERAERAEAEAAAARTRAASAEDARDGALADRVAARADEARVGEAAELARRLADDLAALARDVETEPDGAGTVTDGGEPDALADQRRPLPVPGSARGDPVAATRFLLDAGASVLVDGYNVAMLGWQDLDLADQRRALLDLAENLARRTGADLAVVFDGAQVAGATADRRRLVRVVYSPEGTSADDVIRGEVDRLPPTRPVVVVTNDAEIVRDVRGMGANVVPSEHLLAFGLGGGR